MSTDRLQAQGQSQGTASCYRWGDEEEEQAKEHGKEWPERLEDERERKCVCECMFSWKPSHVKQQGSTSSDDARGQVGGELRSDVGV